MRPNLLPIALANTRFQLEGFLPRVLDREPEFQSFVAVGHFYRRLAIADLLLSGDPPGFYEHLGHSARATLHALENVAPGDALTSKCHSFLDAVASRDSTGAERIARLAPRSPDERREYEEDFLYVHILMGLYAELEDFDPLGAVERYEELAADGEDERLPVCKALVERDQDALGEALHGAIDAMAEKTKKAREEDALDPDAAVTTAYVSIDLLAWMELATRLDLHVEPSYPLAPAAARAFHRLSPLSPDGWKTLGGVDEDADRA
ncbi:MAG: Imm49 family immunity protein [Planctomycetota bacterium]